MTEEEKEQDKKIIIDEDWKQQAQREKEVLVAQEKTEKKKTKEEHKARGPIPKGNFAALVSMLTTQALFAMGLLEVKGQEKREPDLEIARYNIDMLKTLNEKTKGNLTKEEEKILKNTLNELRMAYVTVSNQTS